MTKDTIHYLWVGTPTKKNPSAIAGHDVAGPIKMAKQLQKQSGEDINPIKFWCLDEHKHFYQTQFREEGVNIEVCSIEELLDKENQSEFASQSRFVQDYMKNNPAEEEMSFAGKQISQTWGNIQFKDLFSLFLLLSQGGYFLDTNVFPKKDKIVSLLGELTFTTAKSGFDNANDFYMMYSPSRGHDKALTIFEQWKKPSLFTVTKLHAFCINGERRPFFKLEEIGVRKISYKSYGGPAGGLFFWLLRKNLNKDEDLPPFEEWLKYGDINYQPISKENMKELDIQVKNILTKSHCTLLHQAVLSNNIEQVKSLLKFGAKLDLKAIYTVYYVYPEEKEIELTPKELADVLGYEEISKLLQSQQDHYRSNDNVGKEEESTSAIESKVGNPATQDITYNTAQLSTSNVTCDVENKQDEVSPSQSNFFKAAPLVHPKETNSTSLIDEAEQQSMILKLEELETSINKKF